MSKAYDRVSWLYLCKVLRKLGFDEIFIDMIWRLLANNWYSILLNEQTQGFFHSTKGVRQGDPLSLVLFIILAEVLSRALNSLTESANYQGFDMLKWSTKINHLTYADDTIIFTSAETSLLGMIKEVLHGYEKVSG